jgi:hypothetical protein
MYLVAADAVSMHDAPRLLRDLSALIVREECRPDPVTDEWEVKR